MYFITSQLFSFCNKGQLIANHHRNASIWVGVAEFDIQNYQSDLKKLSTHIPQQYNDSILSKKQLHHYQQVMVRILLKDMLHKLNIIDELDSRQYPYRLQKSQFYVCFSHSHTWVACAISKYHSIGIDIEKNSIDDHISKRFFHPHVISKLATLPTSEKNIYKQLCWMLAEALLKKNNGKRLGKFLQQDYSWILSQLLPILEQPVQCHNLANKQNTQYTTLMPLNNYSPQSSIVQVQCSGIIYLVNPSVVVTY